MPISSGDARKIRNSRNRIEMSLATPMAAALAGWQNNANPPAVKERFYKQLEILIEAERQISTMRFRSINETAADSSAVRRLAEASTKVRKDADKLKTYVDAPCGASWNSDNV